MGIVVCVSGCPTIMYFFIVLYGKIQFYKDATSWPGTSIWYCCYLLAVVDYIDLKNEKNDKYTILELYIVYFIDIYKYYIYIY